MMRRLFTSSAVALASIATTASNFAAARHPPSLDVPPISTTATALRPRLAFDIGAANRTLHLAYASFCSESSLRAWDCQWCDRSSPPGRAPNAEDCGDLDLTLKLQAYLSDAPAGTAGYVAIDLAGREVVVSFRGSADLANTREDAEFWLVDPPFGPGRRRVRVDSGFLAAYLSLRNATADAVRGALDVCNGGDGRREGAAANDGRGRRKDECALLFTGHSLGAAMATMAAAEHADLAPTSLFTFGSPRVGDWPFAVWAHSRILGSHHRRQGNASGIDDLVITVTEELDDSKAVNDASHQYASTRMRRQLDAVPAIPPRSMGYAHLPTEVWNVHRTDGVSGSEHDTYVVCDAAAESTNGDPGEDPHCGISEEHPPFPLDLLHMRPAEHTRYMGYNGGGCGDRQSDEITTS